MAYFRYKHVKDKYDDLSLFNTVAMITRLYYTYFSIGDYNMLKEHLNIIKELNSDVKLFDEDDVVSTIGETILSEYKNIIQLLEIEN